MDSLTQVVLGASVGELVLGKKLGNRAVVYGAVAGLIPDLDIIPGQFMDTVARMEFHRGFSHSLVFTLVAAPLLGWAAARLNPSQQASGGQWARLFFWGLATHILLDCFTTWGTQVFWPHPYRVAWNTIFVIDPLYSVPFFVFTVWLMFKRRGSMARRRLNWLGLGISSLYLLLTVVNKQVAENKFGQALQQQGIHYLRYSSKPTPLNSILWALTAETENGYYVGYYSLFDKDGPVRFQYYEKNHYLLNPWRNEPEISSLLFLTKGYFTVNESESGYVIYDLRFGQLNGWFGGPGDFIFAYRLIKQGPGWQISQFRNITGSPLQSGLELLARLRGL